MNDTVSSKPCSFPWLTPYLAVNSPQESIDFYQRAFGFEVGEKMEHNGTIMHVLMTYHDQSVIMFSPPCMMNGGADDVPPIARQQRASDSFYLYVEDVDAVYKAALTAGANSIEPPHHAPWGDHYAQISDINGYRWGLAHRLEQTTSA